MEKIGLGDVRYMKRNLGKRKSLVKLVRLSCNLWIWGLAMSLSRVPCAAACT